MVPCHHREHLIVEYDEAVERFSQAVKHFRECERSRLGFEQEKRATELARHHAENARTMLNLHCAKHGC